MIVRLDDWLIGARIAIRKTHEPHVTEILVPLLRPGMVFVDIGANIGYFTLLAATHVGENGKVIALEPSDSNCGLMKRSIELNGFSNVTVFPYAAANEERMVGFGMDESNGGIHLDVPAKDCAAQVQAIRLDDLLDGEARIDVIKIDIEGAEWHALQGMKALVRRHQPLIFSEFSPTGLELVSRITPEKYLNGLRELGYRLYVIDRESRLKTRALENDEILKLYENCGYDHLDLMAEPESKFRGLFGPDPI
jgi:FkbM family methyltransferase